jgi:hypothetical protein
MAMNTNPCEHQWIEIDGISGEQKCRFCNGSGENPLTLATSDCKRCGGTGTITNITSMLFGGGNEPKTTPCPKCQSPIQQEKPKGINERLGLPFGKMKWIVIAFDVDGTLIDEGDVQYFQIIHMVKVLAKFKNVKIVVWSGGGKQYAEQQGRLLGLDEYVWKYASKTEHETIQPDIAIDDIQDTAIGGINLIVRNK